jgi:hypothetical protein
MSITLPDKHLSREDYLDMRNRIVSFFHGIISLVLSGYHMYFLQNECGQKNTELERFIINNSAGYFFYDFIAMTYYGLLDWGMFIHHFICIVGMTIGLC